MNTLLAKVLVFSELSATEALADNRCAFTAQRLNLQTHYIVIILNFKGIVAVSKIDVLLAVSIELIAYGLKHNHK